MAVRFQNYLYSYRRNGKPVFVPSSRGEKIGRELKAKIERAVVFDPFLFHLRAGGHVAALHEHRVHRYFARVDIERFFYGISRNRVARNLAEVGIDRAASNAKWSCVRNPYDEPRYALPYGFVQSPILASLVLMRSPVGDFLRSLPPEVTKSVYMDDIALSSDRLEDLQPAFEGLLAALHEGNFSINEEKTEPPSETIALFKCDLAHGNTAVRGDRRAEFFASERSAQSIAAFERYCEGVSAGNDAPAV